MEYRAEKMIPERIEAPEPDEPSVLKGDVEPLVDGDRFDRTGRAPAGASPGAGRYAGLRFGVAFAE